jgi:hypothetical protein
MDLVTKFATFSRRLGFASTLQLQALGHSRPQQLHCKLSMPIELALFHRFSKFLHAALDTPANPYQHIQLVVRQQSWPTEPNDQHSYDREAAFEAHVPPSSAGLYQEESRRAPFK